MPEIVSELNKESDRSSKLKVLWVTPNLHRASGGPTSTITNGLIAERDSGVESGLISTSFRSEVEEVGLTAKLKEAGVKYRLFRQFNQSAYSAAWGLSLGLTFWLVLNIRRYDILHLQYVWCWTTILGCTLARLYRIPVVLTPHESLTSYDIEIASPSKTKRMIKRLLRRFILQNVDALFLMSWLEERDTDSGTVRVYRVPHCVMTPAVTEERISNEVQDRADEKLRIGFIGRQVPKKGIDRLIRAIALSGESRWRLILAGPPPEPNLKTQYHDLVTELGLDGQVRWLGFVNDRDAFLAGIDVLVMPSEYEGFGMAAAEAMASGTPVVVPMESGISPLVEESKSGFIVNEPDAESICKAIAELAASSERRVSMGQRGRAAIEKHHSPSTFGEKTALAYLDLVGIRKASRQ